MPERHPQSRNLLVIGQSHVAAVRAAAKTRREAFPDAPRTRVIHTLEEVHAPEFVNVADGDYSAATFGPKLRAAIEDQIARHDPIVASVMGGNVHNMLALLRHPRPFDFLLPDEHGPSFDNGAELIPEALVRAALEARLAPDFARLRALKVVAGRFLHLESPPPVRDGAFITERAEAAFRERAGTAGIAAAGPGLRWRMWRLSAQLLRRAVEELGCLYLPAPAAARDADGFLDLDFAADPTHGNEAYGELLIRAIEAA
jgi:hypothetical protein